MFLFSFLMSFSSQRQRKVKQILKIFFFVENFTKIFYYNLAFSLASLLFETSPFLPCKSRIPQNSNMEWKLRVNKCLVPTNTLQMQVQFETNKIKSISHFWLQWYRCYCWRNPEDSFLCWKERSDRPMALITVAICNAL